MATNQPFGKFVFIWKVPELMSGNAQQIGEAALAAGIKTIIVKFVNGKFVYTPAGYPSWGYNLRRQDVGLWQSLGLNVWGYVYLLGEDPQKEAQVAADEALRLGLDGVALDVEIEFETAQIMASAESTLVQFIQVKPHPSLGLVIKAILDSEIERRRIPARALMKSPFELQANPVGNAHKYMQIFQSIAPAMPTAFISFPLFRSPTTGGTWHNREMYVAFLQYCNFAMPMTYWWGSTKSDMLWMLDNSLKQWAEIAHGKPILPIGRLYTGDGGTATAGTIAAFGKELHTRGLIGGGGWRFGTGIVNADWWNAFTNWPKWQNGQPPGPPTVPLDEWARQLDSWAREQGYTGPQPPQS